MLCHSARLLWASIFEVTKIVLEMLSCSPHVVYGQSKVVTGIAHLFLGEKKNMTTSQVGTATDNIEKNVIAATSIGAAHPLDEMAEGFVIMVMLQKSVPNNSFLCFQLHICTVYISDMWLNLFCLNLT